MRVNIDDMMSEIAACLRDVIDETTDAPDTSPEELYRDLAARLVLKLSRRRLTIADAIKTSSGDAAIRILDILSNWIDGRLERHYITRMDSSGKHEIVMREAGAVKAFFQGETVQDAYAQAAQTISFEGEFDGEEEQAQG